MGIYKNNDLNPRVFHTHNDKQITSNQKIYKGNYLQTILEEQSRINTTFKDSMEHVEESIKTTSDSHSDQLRLMLSKLSQQEILTVDLQELLQNQEIINELLMNKLSLLEKKNEVLLEKMESDSLLTQAILDQQSTHDQALNKLTKNLDVEESVITQLQKQDEVFDEFANKLELQEVFHNTVMERLDQQEGLIKKMIGEIDHLRSIIYERASHIAEKIEDNMNRITKPIQRFFVHTDMKEKEKVD